MIILRLNNISFSYLGGLVLENLTWSVQNTDKLGLVGPNGAGKSTILKLMAGQVTVDSGVVTTAKEVTVGYLPQEVILAPQQTILLEALTASPRLAAIEAELQQIEAALSDPAVYGDEAALTHTLDRQSHWLAVYEEAGGLSYENTVKSTLCTFHVSEPKAPYGRFTWFG